MPVALNIIFMVWFGQNIFSSVVFVKFVRKAKLVSSLIRLKVNIEPIDMFNVLFCKGNIVKFVVIESKFIADIFNCQVPSLININTSPFVAVSELRFVTAVKIFINLLAKASIANICCTD